MAVLTYIPDKVKQYSIYSCCYWVRFQGRLQQCGRSVSGEE